MDKPHIIYKAKVSKDGDQYCCLYGDDLVSGIVGFGNTPKEACANFDRLWNLGDEKSPDHVSPLVADTEVLKQAWADPGVMIEKSMREAFKAASRIVPTPAE